MADREKMPTGALGRFTMDCDSPSPLPRCWTCGYILRGLERHRCPECGREFDPDDPETVNLGVPLSWAGRRLIRPVGWLLPAIALAGTALIAWTTGWPVRFQEHFLDWPMLKAWVWPSGARASASPEWRIFVGGIGVALAASVVLILRAAIRWALLLRFRPPAELRRPRRLPVIAWMIFLIAAGVLVEFGGSRRIGHEWVASSAAALRPTSLPAWVYTASTQPACPVPSLSDEDRVATIRMLIQHGPDARHRRWGCRLLAEMYPSRLSEELIAAVAKERDGDLVALELRLIGLCRVEKTGAIERFMDDPRPGVAAAAIDAVGLAYGPAYPVPLSDGPVWRGAVDEIAGNPPIRIVPILADTNGRQRPPYRPLPAELRERLRAVMLGDVPVDKREAAARPMLPKAPREYKLRVAEWGVWLADTGELKTMRQIASEIPPFVHRAGNPVAEMKDRVNPIMIITKPVIHLTVSEAMAVDVEVRLRAGRPWVVYPMPDDFEVLVQTKYRPVLTTRPTTGPAYQMGLPPGGPEFLRPLDNPGLGVLPVEKLRSGYPWIEPGHRSSGPISSKMGGVNDIYEMGVHWQSLVVTPDKQGWMTEPAVSGDPGLAWWKRLREVECSWVWSRGESERFLYYDGPTLLKAPLTVWREGDLLHFAEVAKQSDHDEVFAPAQPPPRGPRRGGFLDAEPGSRQGIYVDVGERGVSGSFLPAIAARGDARVNQGPPMLGEQVEKKLLAIARERGMSESESAGLIDCWQKYFFGRPGRRLLLILSPADYDFFCPMIVRPAPTSQVRLGIVVYEL